MGPRFWMVVLGMSVVSSVPGCGAASPTGSTVPQVRRTFTASAAGVTESDLGSFYDANFAPLVGPDHAIRDCALEDLATTEEERNFHRVANGDELRANLMAWDWTGEATVGVASSDYREFGVYRVVHGERRVRLDRGCALSRAPEGARYYLAGVVVGWSYEIAFRRRASSSSLSASFNFADVLGAGVEAWAGSSSLDWHEVARGLRRAGPEASPSGESPPGAVAYTRDGDAVVVLAEYAEVPRALRATSRTEAPTTAGAATAENGLYRVELRRLSFPQYAPGNVGWDPGGLPDGLVNISQDGATLLSRNGRDDALESRWAEGSAFVATVRPITDRSPLVLRVWDRDVFEDDAAAIIEVTPNDLTSCEAWPLPEHGTVCSFSSAEGVSVWIHLTAAD